MHPVGYLVLTASAPSHYVVGPVFQPISYVPPAFTIFIFGQPLQLGPVIAAPAAPEQFMSAFPAAPATTQPAVQPFSSSHSKVICSKTGYFVPKLHTDDTRHYPLKN
ncbi:hypothetical protein D8674_025826 [Pyrus ussuriensis x Pyrus communis]|uniref:Uncharacterized protein n=1 Tax=Pyrus ussuriensis x Pyrus communis TaxID=2448454 RepID=A0A5N5I9Z8_9ROSA|nr:hypothetical protein D8674_025826 [Pyrus ussuriensis x Pyrus communis]